MERKVMKCVIVMFSNYEAATVSGVLCYVYIMLISRVGTSVPGDPQSITPMFIF